MQFSFSANYTPKTVDIAAVVGGQTTTFRGVSISQPSVAASVMQTHAIASTPANGTSIGSTLKAASTAFNFAVCTLAGAEATTGIGLAGIALNWPLVATACGSTFVTILTNLGLIDDASLNAGLEKRGKPPNYFWLVSRMLCLIF